MIRRNKQSGFHVASTLTASDRVPASMIRPVNMAQTAQNRRSRIPEASSELLGRCRQTTTEQPGNYTSAHNRAAPGTDPIGGMPEPSETGPNGRKLAIADIENEGSEGMREAAREQGGEGTTAGGRFAIWP